MRSARFILWGIGLILLVGISACGLRSGRLGSETQFEAGAAVYAVCSEECKARAQCGTIDTDPNTQLHVVLMSATFPASRNHDLVMQDNLPMNIVESRTEQMVIEGSDAPPFDMFYYLLQSPEGTNPSVKGWLQGSCVSTRQVNH